MESIDNKKQLEILKTAKELFWKHGFRRVSVEEICRKANVSKMTFYKFYPNKVELAKAVFDEEINRSIRHLNDLMKEKIPAAEKIRKLIKIKYEGTNDISREFLQDFYSSPELGLKSYVEERTRKVWDEFIKDFKKAQHDGWIRKDLNLEFFIHVSQKITELVTDDYLLKLYDNPQDLIMEFTNLLTYGIAGRE